MKTLRHFSILALVALLGAGLAACDDDVAAPANDPAGTDDFAAIDLEAPDGGLTPTDEQVAFGDATLLRELAFEDEELFDDPILTDATVATMMHEADQMHGDGDRPMRRSYFLRMVWGNLEGPVDDETGEVVDLASADWSGSLQVDRGAVIVRRVIRFERGIDRILPREDRTLLEWESYTGGHFDGLLVQIIEPLENRDGMGPGDGGPELANMVHLNAGSFSAEFATTEIPGLDRTAEQGEAGAIHLLGFEHNGEMGCPRGFLAGIWVDQPDVNGGVFRGRWVNMLGITTGFMQGRWGVNEANDRVFAGKVISRHGHFEGFLRGQWAPSEDRPGVGFFHGGWRNEAGTRQGVLGGRYRHVPDRTGGFYHGRWSAACDIEAEALLGS